MKTVSVLIPAYNEAKTILNVLKKVKEQKVVGFDFEVIVIDDGSTDGTLDLLKKNEELYSGLVALGSNRGKGAAIREGLGQAKGEYILFQDADLEYDPADYQELLVPIQRFNADIVMGSRMVAPEYTRVSYFWNKVGNRLITLFFNALNNKSFTDIYSCYLVYRRELFESKELFSEGWEQQAEILSICVARAKIIYEVPISYHGRTHSEGKKIKYYDVIQVFWMIFKMRLSVRCKRQKV